MRMGRDLFANRMAADEWEPEVEDDEIGRADVEQSDRRKHIPRLLNPVPGERQRCSKDSPHVGLVVNDQDGGHYRR